MITNLEEIKRRVRSGMPLINRGDGWLLGRRCGGNSMKFYDSIPQELVALLCAQGFINTSMKVVGEAKWNEKENTA